MKLENLYIVGHHKAAQGNEDGDQLGLVTKGHLNAF